jgi:phenylalanyl-tRNA synthetase beta chain
LKFSYRWLSDIVPGLSTKPAELERLITMKTAECEGIERWGEHFGAVVSARVVDIEPLPKGKNQRVVIDAGSAGKHTVVCGAPNVRAGMLAAWVPPGTGLLGKQIRVAKIEGVESEGMLASAAELGLNRDSEGLLELAIEPGSTLAGVEPDWIIEIDNKSLTHRPDLWGHVGMAREVAAITGGRLSDPVHLERLPSGVAPIAVSIEDYTLCPRYSALVFDNVKVGPSPLWLQARLEAIGLNPINNVVDVTNYILAELPQPMHAFDRDKLRGGTISVRRAKEGERLKALNDEEYALSTNDLVIADERGAVAIAGVIGGIETSISDSTTRIVLESANFQAASVRFTSTRHRLRTDASMRFEKSLDPENTFRGLARAVELLEMVCPGIRVTGGTADNRTPSVMPAPIELPLDFVSRKLGEKVSEAQMRGILESLGFRVETGRPGKFLVTTPSWRATKDISIKEDLVEEIGRMIGYGEITPQAPLLAVVTPPSNPVRMYLRRVRCQMAAQGFTEAYNYSFVNEAQWKRFGWKPEDHIAVSNPIASDLTHMRRSLLPGVFETILKNTRHYQEFRFFEIGRGIHPQADSSPREINHLAAALYGAHADEREFFELKRVAECLFPSANLCATEPFPWEHPMRASRIEWRGKIIGRLFELHPALLDEEKVEGRAFMFDVDLDLAQTLDNLPRTYRPLRRYPTSAFDLSVIADLHRPVAEIQEELARLGGKALVSIEFVRQYTGPPLEQGRKSVSYRLEIGSDERTLTNEEVSDVRSKMIEGLRAEGYDLRV